MPIIISWGNKYKSRKTQCMVCSGMVRHKGIQNSIRKLRSPVFPDCIRITMSTPFDACRGIQAPIKNAVVAIQQVNANVDKACQPKGLVVLA